MIALVEGATVAWPLLVAIACAVAIDRHREGRRRAALNRAMHELRRPLQFLALAWSTPEPAAPTAAAPTAAVATRGQLDAALAALADLDAEINGRRCPERRSPLRADVLVGEAVDRWRSPAAALGRDLELRWRAGRATVLGDREALSRAIDNLVANSLEHGAQRIRVEGTVADGRLRIAVADGQGRTDGDRAKGRAAHERDRNPRRGHGLALVARTASRHGGRFAFVRGESRARAVLELPLAAEPARSLRHRAPCDAA